MGRGTFGGRHIARSTRYLRRQSSLGDTRSDFPSYSRFVPLLDQSPSIILLVVKGVVGDRRTGALDDGHRMLAGIRDYHRCIGLVVVMFAWNGSGDLLRSSNLRCVVSTSLFNLLSFRVRLRTQAIRPAVWTSGRALDIPLGDKRQRLHRHPPPAFSGIA